MLNAYFDSKFMLIQGTKQFNKNEKKIAFRSLEIDIRLEERRKEPKRGHSRHPIRHCNVQMSMTWCSKPKNNKRNGVTMLEGIETQYMLQRETTCKIGKKYEKC